MFAVIDTLRARNVEIAFAQLKMTAEAIREGLRLSAWTLPRDDLLDFLQQLALHTASPGDAPPMRSPLVTLPFTLDQVDILTRIVPTDEEVARTLAHPPSSTSAGAVEHFFRVVSVIPRVKRRVDLLSFLLSSPSDLLVLSSSLALLHAAHVQVVSSSSLRRFLKLVLTVGNTLNAGSSQGEAYGFRLSLAQRDAAGQDARRMRNDDGSACEGQRKGRSRERGRAGSHCSSSSG